MKRTFESDEAKKASKTSVPANLVDEEGEEVDDEVTEQDLRRAGTDVLGAIMAAAPEEFTQQALNECGERMTQWNTKKEFRVSVVHVGSELLKNLKEASQPIWSSFMESVFEGLVDEEADMRISSSYAINLAAQIQAFSSAAPQAFKEVAKCLAKSASKKRDMSMKMAMDNAVSALLQLLLGFPDQCPADIDGWQLVVEGLPIKEDEEEAQTVHQIVAEKVIQQHAGLIGPNQSRLPKILCALSEIYKMEDLCKDTTDALILQIFTHIPKETLVVMASSFTEKQQKKIEGMLAPKSAVATHGG